MLHSHNSRRLLKSLPVVLMLASLPVIVHGVSSLESNSSDVSQWLSATSDSRREYEDFVNLFGPDDILFVSWTDCTADDPRLEQMAIALRGPSDVSSPHKPATWIHRVTTGPEILEKLTANPVGLPADEAIDRLAGLFFSADGRRTGLLLELSEAGRTRQHEIIDSIIETAATCGIDSRNLRLGGSVYEAVMMDRESFQSYRHYTPAIALTTVSIIWICFRDIRLTLLIFATAAYCRFLAAAVVYYAGSYMTVVSIVMPMLVFVLTLSGAVHLANYYLDTRAELGRAGAGARALKAGWAPCVMAAISTSVGMVSLTVSELEPVRNFGLFSACGLMSSLVVLLAVLPALFDLGHTGANRAAESTDSTKRVPRRLSKRPIAWTDGFTRQWRHSLVIGLAIVLACGWGTVHLRTNVKLERLFHSDTEIVRNYRWIEREIGPLIPVEVLIRMDSSCRLPPVSRVLFVERVEMELRHLDHVGGVFSAATLTPRLDDATGLGAITQRAALSKRLPTLRKEFIEYGLLRIDGNAEIWRVTARIPALHDDDYGTFISEIQRGVESAAASGNFDAEGIGITYTGLLPMLHHSQQQLMRDLINSFQLAVILICPMMILACRSVTAGLIAMIPNLCPVVIVFGAMGWLGIEIDIGTILTASVALGIAVDDTLHLVAWFRRGAAAGMSREAAVRFACAKCGPAMIYTTLICGLGLLVMVQSTFIPTSRFGVLIFCLITTALWGDLVLFTAILTSPAGRLFAGPADSAATDARKSTG